MSDPSAVVPRSIEFFQKPNTMDNTPKYEKPNAYDEEPPVVITPSRHGSRSSKMTMDSFASRYYQRKKDVAKVMVADMDITENVINGECYSPNTPIKSPPLSPKTPVSITKERSVYNSQLDYQHITSYILSQSTPTTQMSFGHHDEDDTCSTLPSYYVLPSSPANSITGIDTNTLKNNAPSTNVAAATAALLSNDSGITSSFFLLPSKRHTTIVNTLANNNTFSKNSITYNFKKASVLKPYQHHIYLHIDHQEEEDDEEIMVYRKIQPYSYTWGLHSMLYSNRNDGQGIKVAEARRRAFQKEIFIEAADYENSEIDDISRTHINKIKKFPATNNIYCENLIKKSQSNILFEYEIWFNGSRMRWKRPSLLSNDFTCEVKLTREETKLFQEQQRKASITSNKKQKSKSKKVKSTVGGYVTRTEDNEFIDSDSDNDEDDHDGHTHKSCRRWKLLAEFHSHNSLFMNKDLGKLSIDLDILNQVEKERCDLLEANIVMTCSTLIDLIRDIMGKP